MFENNEDTPGWKAAESVAYCGSCFNQKMERGSCQSIMTKSQDDEAFSEDVVTVLLESPLRRLAVLKKFQKGIYQINAYEALGLHFEQWNFCIFLN